MEIPILKYFVVVMVLLFFKLIKNGPFEYANVSIPEEPEYQPILDMLDKADAYMEEKRFSEAIDLYNHVLELDIRPVERLKILCTLSTAYFFVGNIAESIDVTLRAHQINDESLFKTFTGAYLLGWARGKLLLAQNKDSHWNWLPPFAPSAPPTMNLRVYQGYTACITTSIITATIGSVISLFLPTPVIELSWLGEEPVTITLISMVIGYLYPNEYLEFFEKAISALIPNKTKQETYIISFWILFFLSILSLPLMPFIIYNLHFWLENLIFPLTIGILVMPFVAAKGTRTIKDV